jgi:hypothetical protein
LFLPDLLFFHSLYSTVCFITSFSCFSPSSILHSIHPSLLSLQFPDSYRSGSERAKLARVVQIVPFHNGLIDTAHFC